MNPEHKRIVELASGWEGSDAEVTVSPGDALLLESVGCPLKRGPREIDPAAVKGRDLFAAARKLAQGHVQTPEGAQPTPNQQSVSAGPNATNVPKVGEGDGLEDLTVADLRTLATERGVTLPGNAVKAQLVDAIRKAPKK